MAGAKSGRRSPRKVLLVQRDEDGLDGVAHRLQQRLDGGGHEGLKTLEAQGKEEPLEGRHTHEDYPIFWTTEHT